MHKIAKKRLIKIILILVAIGSFVGMGLLLMKQQLMFFKTPTQILDMKNSVKSQSKQLRLGGVIVKGSLRQSNMVHTMLVTDNQNTIKVSYKGRLPDLLKEGQAIICGGIFLPDQKIFQATTILAKHDEYYIPKSNNSKKMPPYG